MFVSVARRIAVALITGGVAFGGLSLAPASASADVRHHGGWHRSGGSHGHYAGGYHRHYYGGGGYYGGYGYYGAPGCVPALGLLSGDYCGY